MAGLIPVPIYDSLGPNSAEYIINHSESTIIVVSQAKLNGLKAALKSGGIVNTVLVIGEFEARVEDRITFRSCESVLSEGVAREFGRPDPDSLGIIMYTSGSTGRPKGCMLTHRNLVAGATGLGCLGCSITTSDTYYSLLPLAHIYEMGVELIMIAQGAAIGFFSGNPRQLTDDLQALKPTIICGVPRLWNRIVDNMKTKIEGQSGAKKALVKWALALKRRQLYDRENVSLLLDGVVFRPFREALGGRVRLIVSGGAPILPDVYDFLIAAVSPNIVQGYGLTEVAASVAVSEVPQLGPCDNGAVSQTSKVKLVKVDGLNYDPRGSPMRGEVLVQGPHIFKGYYKDEELTRQVLDAEGWYRTGDIGGFTENGYLQIVDRAKQLVKLSQGEYLSLTALSDTYGATPGLKNVYVYADSHHDAPLAVVVPGPELVKQWELQGIGKFIGNAEAEAQVLALLNRTAQEQRLRGFERIARVLLDSEEFSVENGLLTPSMKPQWPSLKKKYEASLIELFRQPVQ
jgi:long-chain acyl-CoA synthetase